MATRNLWLRRQAATPQGPDRGPMKGKPELPLRTGGQGAELSLHGMEGTRSGLGAVAGFFNGDRE